MAEDTNGAPDPQSYPQSYHGELTLPGETAPRAAVLHVDGARPSVTLVFDAPVAGANEWSSTWTQVIRKPKYTEVWFKTSGLPVGAVELMWKCNAGHEDGSLAGVVTARPNEEKVSGEKGFIMARPT